MAFDDRTTARIVGALFIVATVTAIVGGGLVVAIEDEGAVVAVDDVGVVSGVLLELVLVVSVVGIAALLVPVLRRQNEGLAFAYLGSRLLESVLLLVASTTALVFVSPGGASDVVLALRDRSYLLGSMALLGVSALILNALLYGGRLVPRWLAVWGLVGGALILVRGVVELYGVELATAAQAVLAAPIALGEMVLAVWLIARGFASAARAPAPDRTRETVGAGPAPGR